MSSNGEGFGLDYYGVGPWGILPPTGVFSLEGIFAASERTIRVTFTQAALLGTPFREGAALNLNTWSVSLVGDPTDPLLVSVREVEGSGARQFELYTLRLLPRYPAQIVVAFPYILAETLAPLTGATQGQLDGAAKPQVTRERNRSSPADVRSVPLPGTLSGTLGTTAGGDYETEEGVALLRKLVLRRLTTPRGAFRHLPSFGLGLKSKDTLRGGGINDLRLAIEREVQQEPDVADVRASLSYNPAAAILTVRLKIRRVSTGEDVELAEQFNLNEGVVT